jgi:hypothetical protein
MIILGSDSGTDRDGMYSPPRIFRTCENNEEYTQLQRITMSDWSKVDRHGRIRVAAYCIMFALERIDRHFFRTFPKDPRVNSSIMRLLGINRFWECKIQHGWRKIRRKTTEPVTGTVPTRRRCNVRLW